MKIPAGWKEYVDFRSKSVYERAKLLAASGKRTRLNISPAHVLELIERYPSLYREARTTPTSKACRFAVDGFCIGDGWHGLVDRLSAKLSADPNLCVWQIKEKYGSLRVYFCDTPSDPRLGKVTDAALDKATRESVRTCEICGKPGTLTRRRNWVSVRCKACLKVDDAEKKMKSEPWGGALRFPRKPATTWFNDIIVACLNLPQCAEDIDFNAFKSSRPRQAAALRHMHQIGDAASRQPADIKRQYRAVDWKALIRLKKRTARMTPREIWGFVCKVAPALLEKLADDEGLLVAQKRFRDRDRLLSIEDINRLLREGRRRSKRKAARAAAEAREDASDLRVVERHLADLRAGRVRLIPHERVMLDLGMDPFKDRLKKPRPWPVYDFAFWEARRPPGGWRCHALALPGILGIGGTAAGAKDCLFTRLALLEKSTKAPGERKLCRRLLGTWKATAAMRMQDFVFWEEEGIWSAVAPSVQGVYGTGPTVTAAKDDLVEALKAMAGYLEEIGEGKKAADCGRLVKAWKAKTRGKP
ncbi:MAG: HepT-like ribonuclease domain-containing protein [Polyangia bacterium]